MSKRNIFGELKEGLAVMKSRRNKKITLRTYNVDTKPLPKVDSKLIRDTRKRLRCSRAVFARKLRINERTLEKWEQGRAKPNPQAAALVLLVRRFPDTLARARLRHMDARDMLSNNDSTAFFRGIGDSVECGPTQTNVNDFRVILVDPT